MKNYIFSLFISLLLVGCATPEPVAKSTTVRIGEQHFLCEIASNDEKRAQGLMFREYLDKNAGMLFDLKKEKVTGFWMKNTLIPLDIVWINNEKEIIDIQTAQPCHTQDCPTFQTKKPARWILEVNAGAFPGKVGDSVEFEL